MSLEAYLSFILLCADPEIKNKVNSENFQKDSSWWYVIWVVHMPVPGILHAPTLVRAWWWPTELTRTFVREYWSVQLTWEWLLLSMLEDYYLPLNNYDLEIYHSVIIVVHIMKNRQLTMWDKLIYVIEDIASWILWRKSDCIH